MLVCECEGRWKQERDALLHLKAIAGLKEWGEKKWVDGTDCCRWSGVRCNTRRRVSELNLSWMRDDEDLGNWYLNLSDFQAFDDIKILQLHDNNIAGFVEKKGNEIFLWQVSLESLDLSVNQLSNDYIISFLSGFQHLKSLDLSYNQLEGSLDINGICALSKLERLDLSYNFNIGGFVVPQGNERFSWQTCRPEVLALSHNNLSNDITSSFNWFSHLKFLDLSYNQLEGSLDISGICALSKLEELNLSYNDNISGFVVPQGTNIYLDNLKVLHLEGLKMDGSMLRQSLRAFSSVRELYMNSSTFNGTIVAADFGDLVKLEKLILDESSNIGNEFLKSIGVLTSLKVLSLNSCGIKGSFPIEGWSELKKLEVQYPIASVNFLLRLKKGNLSLLMK
ncbi:hypothetical protein L6164_033044 [Bauhinia variegata]|uniref:Uncharacterized protein n=1 Tax=Bauhinia variegata TaxID=167791 RepID=A0ACB9KQS6_BAUVA|nr:hypothetical protein L6164_033044 [Bauhinia variegata]